MTAPLASIEIESAVTSPHPSGSEERVRRVLPPRTPEDDARLRSMVTAHHALIWRVVRRLGVSDAEADDAVQEVFFVAAARLGDIESGKERAFLYSSAARVAANFRRARKRRQNAYDSFGEAPTEEIRQPDDLSDQRRARAVLDEILDSLPDEMREVLVLFEMKELSIQEIAEALDIPTGTVGSRLRRARERFQAAVERRKVQEAFKSGGRG